jgi:hypothetical protein
MSNNIDAKDYPGLTPAEKEVTIRFDRDSDRLHVCSDVGSITARLLQHPDFEEEDRTTIDGNVVQVSGTLPVGVLSIKSKPRTNNHLGQVVSGGVLQE